MKTAKRGCHVLKMCPRLVSHPEKSALRGIVIDRGGGRLRSALASNTVVGAAATQDTTAASLLSDPEASLHPASLASCGSEDALASGPVAAVAVVVAAAVVS